MSKKYWTSKKKRQKRMCIVITYKCIYVKKINKFYIVFAHNNKYTICFVYGYKLVFYFWRFKMNYLIKIEQSQIGTELVESVNARELHEKLQVGRDFSTWIKQRIDELNVLENIDYTRMAELSLPKMGEGINTGFQRIEYTITLDFAKHLAMVEKNEIGRQIRQYFIDFEKQARQKKASLDFLSKEAEASKRLAAVFGLTGNQALLSANKVMQKTYGVDCIKLLEVDLVSEKQEKRYTPTELGNLINPKCSAILINNTLELLEFQEKERDNKNKLIWKLTESGKKYGIYLDTGKKHSSGAPVNQIKWHESVVPEIQKEINKLFA